MASFFVRAFGSNTSNAPGEAANESTQRTKMNEQPSQHRISATHNETRHHVNTQISTLNSSPAQSGGHGAAPRNPHKVPKLTQADMDHAWFTSKKFQEFLHQQDEHIIKHAQWLLEMLHAWKQRFERRSEEVRELTIRLTAVESIEKDLAQARGDVQKLQKDALGSVHRFQPTNDGDISNQLEMIGRAIDKVINHLCRAGSGLSSEEWVMTALRMVPSNTICTSHLRSDIAERTLHRVALRNLLWTYLLRRVFEHPFGGYLGDAAVAVEQAYKALYAEPGLNIESNTWRSLSATRLQEADGGEASTAHLEGLEADIKQCILAPLGFQTDSDGIAPKLRDLVVRATTFWRLIARQRAFFEFKFPMFDSHLEWKVDDDLNVSDGEQDEQDDQALGAVWLWTRPMLLKRGDGQGMGLDQVITIAKARGVVAQEGAPGRDKVVIPAGLSVPKNMGGESTSEAPTVYELSGDNDRMCLELGTEGKEHPKEQPKEQGREKGKKKGKDKEKEKEKGKGKEKEEGKDKKKKEGENEDEVKTDQHQEGNGEETMKAVGDRHGKASTEKEAVKPTT